MGSEYNSNSEKINECIEGIIKLYGKLGKPPTVNDYDNYAREKGLPQRRNLERKMGMKWSQICREATGESNQYQKSKDEIYQEILHIKETIGRVPMASELKEFGFNFKQCYRVFGCTYNETIKMLFGWEADKNWKKKTNEELIEDFVSLYNELGRVPTFEEIDSCPNMASSSTYRKKIGNVFELCELANIENIKIDKEHGISCGHVFFDLNNEICLSQPELLISNLLIENNVEFIKEYNYINVIKDANPRRRFDWFIPKFNVYIEYFGLFDKKSIDKDTRIGKYSRKVLDKIEQCKQNNINLICLYKKDLNNNLQGVKNKLSSYIKLS